MLYGINQLWGDVPVVCVIHMYIEGAYLAISRLIMLNVFFYIYNLYIVSGEMWFSGNLGCNVRLLHDKLKKSALKLVVYYMR